ncbi:MAG: hypothetical protein JNJ73_17320 [Hyphomonadaceae bacterium]|nr:hypothetical protein [Hyphomonadaceae bacterium]
MGRTLLAWLCAVDAAAWSAMATQTLVQWWRFPEAPPSLGDPKMLFSMTTAMAVAGAIFGAPAGAGAIVAIRHFEWSRPLADIAFAALAAVSGAALCMALNVAFNAVANGAPFVSQGAYALGLLGGMLLMLVAGGAVGGCVYWLVAGRPAPPYS